MSRLITSAELETRMLEETSSPVPAGRPGAGAKRALQRRNALASLENISRAIVRRRSQRLQPRPGP